MIPRKRHRVGKSIVLFGSLPTLFLLAGALPWRALLLVAGLLLMPGAALAVSATRRASLVCVGDCDDTGTVTLDEIVKGLGIASGSLSLDRCPSFDCHGIGRLTLDCIIRADSLGGFGVHAVGFDFANNLLVPYVAFVGFADGSSQNLALHASPFQFLSPPADFFGLTSSVEIARIHIGLTDGRAEADNLFAIDNLSVPARTPSSSFQRRR